MNNIEQEFDEFKCDMCCENNKHFFLFSCKHNICYKCFYKILIRSYLPEIINSQEIKISCICNKGNLKITVQDLIDKFTYLNDNKDEFILKENKKKKDKCELHLLKKLTEFCFDCSEEICIECKKEKKHLNHNILNINLFKEEFKEKIENLPDLEDLLKWYDKEIKNLFPKYIKNLDEKFDILIRNINDYRKQVKQILMMKIQKFTNPMKLSYLIYKFFNYEKINSLEDIHQIIFILNTKIILPELNLNYDKFENEIEKIIKSVNSLNLENSMELILKEKFKEFEIYQNIENAHNSDISCLSKLSNNKLISGDYEGNLKLWKQTFNGFNNIQKGKAHNGKINNLVNINYGKFASTSIKDNFILIWKENNNDERYKIIEKYVFEMGNFCIILNNLNDNNTLISSFNDNKLHLLEDKENNNKYKQIKLFGEHLKSINTIIQLQTGEIVSGSDDKTLKIWKKFSLSETLLGHKDYVTDVIELSNNKICSSSSDKKIIIWERKNLMDKFNLSQILQGHYESIRTLIGLNDGRIISGSIDETIKIWVKNKEKYEPFQSLLNNKGGVSKLVKINDEAFVSCSWDKSIKFWVSFKT